MATITYIKTSAGLNLLRDGTSGAQNPKISYVAVGTSNTTPTPDDTKLGAEVFRKAVTSYTNGITGEVVYTLYLAPSDAVGVNIAEVAFFGGNASGAANTGVMVARGLYAHSNKLATESIQISLDSIFS